MALADAHCPGCGRPVGAAAVLAGTARCPDPICRTVKGERLPAGSGSGTCGGPAPASVGGIVTRWTVMRKGQGAVNPRRPRSASRGPHGGGLRCERRSGTSRLRLRRWRRCSGRSSHGNLGRGSPCPGSPLPPPLQRGLTRLAGLCNATCTSQHVPMRESQPTSGRPPDTRPRFGAERGGIPPTGSTACGACCEEPARRPISTTEEGLECEEW